MSKYKFRPFKYWWDKSSLATCVPDVGELARIASELMAVIVVSILFVLTPIWWPIVALFYAWKAAQQQRKFNGCTEEWIEKQSKCSLWGKYISLK